MEAALSAATPATLFLQKLEWKSFVIAQEIALLK